MGQVLGAPFNQQVVQLMDDLSDEVCQVFDAAECCRNVHADAAWRAAAASACGGLAELISEINHHCGMYDKLARTMARFRASAAAAADGRSISGQMSAAELVAFCPETAMVGSKLQLDMEKAGIQLLAAGSPQRRRMQELMAMSSHYPAKFSATLSNPQALGSVSVPSRQLPPSWRHLARSTGSFSLPLDAPSVHHFLSTADSEAGRKLVYLASSRSPAANLSLLDELVAGRSEMSLLLGYDSYAQLKAEGASLAGAPAAAVGFLEDLAVRVRGQADAEAERLRRLKALHTGDKGAQLQPWDVDYYTARVRSQQQAAAGSLAAAASLGAACAPYLHLDSVLSGLSSLMHRLLGLSLRPQALGPGEGWAPGLRKLEVWDGDGDGGSDSGGGGGGGGGSCGGGRRLGSLYLDLAPRPGKLQGSVLFPVRCGRQLPGGAYQQPILVLVASCGEQAGVQVLSWRELRTLLHEVGHAVHNLVSHTRYQHLWGTRCAQDVVEVPSHLWEHFTTDPAALALLARHATSRDAMPAALAHAASAAACALPALELQQQLLLALVDLAYHGPAPPPAGATASDVWARLSAQHSSVAHVAGVSPQARFAHLTMYGATYYAYSYARCLSEALWRRHLAADPLARGAGQELRRLLLEPGGSLEPLDLISRALGSTDALRQLAGGWCPNADDYLASVVAASNGGGSGTKL